MAEAEGETEPETQPIEEPPAFDSNLKVIKIFAGTKKKLDYFGRKNETYAELVNRLIDNYTILENGGRV